MDQKWEDTAPVRGVCYSQLLLKRGAKSYAKRRVFFTAPRHVGMPRSTCQNMRFESAEHGRIVTAQACSCGSRAWHMASQLPGICLHPLPPLSCPAACIKPLPDNATRTMRRWPPRRPLPRSAGMLELLTMGPSLEAIVRSRLPEALERGDARVYIILISPLLS